MSRTSVMLPLLLSLAAVISLSITVTAQDTGREERLGPARTMLADIAKELIARSGTSSQVLSLNLTNLVILLVLKGLLVGAAMWGTGAWKGRSEEGGVAPPTLSLLTEAELALLISYLMGEADHNYDCLMRVACLEPKKAREYLAAGKMAIKGAKVLDKVVPVNPKYERLLDQLHQAVLYGTEAGRGVCDQQYSCRSIHKHNHV